MGENNIMELTGQLVSAGKDAAFEGGTLGAGLDLSNPFVWIIAIVLIALMCYGSESSKGSGKKYKSSEVKRQEVDKSADKYEMVEKATGKVLFSGTSDECAKWRKENVEPLSSHGKR